PLVAYSGNLVGSVNNFSIYGGSAERAYTAVNDAVNHNITFSSKIVAHHAEIETEHELVPGGGSDFFNQPFFNLTTLNSTGQVAFYSNTYSPGFGNKGGVFFGDSISLTTVARQYQSAPGAGGGSLNLGRSQPYNNPYFLASINTAGQVAFESPLINTTDGSTDGIFRYDPGAASVSAIAREKQAIPGFPGQTLGPLARYSTGSIAL